MYAVRLLTSNSESHLLHSSLRDVLKYRITKAVELRNTINLPSTHTNVYRLLNGEGDRLSGLVADVFNNSIVIHSSAIWVEKHKELIISIFNEIYNNNTSNDNSNDRSMKEKKYNIIWKQSESHLRQDGYTHSSNISDKDKQLSPNKVNNTTSENNTTTNNSNNNTTSNATNTIVNEIIVIENNIKYITYPGYGQKTGFYCDHRNNRQMLNKFCKGIYYFQYIYIHYIYT
jgi:23S rRNA G2069 N7-methylase RlmK/C1962 C5-methylase RlmI